MCGSHCSSSCPFLSHYVNTVCPTRYRIRHFLNFTTNEDIATEFATIRRTTDTFLFISHTTNVLLFKFRCNIFIGVRIIKEMPGSVASGTPCITETMKLRIKTVYDTHNFSKNIATDTLYSNTIYSAFL